MEQEQRTELSNLRKDSVQAKKDYHMMECAKQESKRKSALADFLKVKQITAHDRVSFFGLMVKPNAAESLTRS